MAGSSPWETGVLTAFANDGNGVIGAVGLSDSDGAPSGFGFGSSPPKAARVGISVFAYPEIIYPDWKCGVCPQSRDFLGIAGIPHDLPCGSGRLCKSLRKATPRFLRKATPSLRRRPCCCDESIHSGWPTKTPSSPVDVRSLEDRCPETWWHGSSSWR